MTVLRKEADNVSNYFNALENGIGHRGSSFCDVDRLTHDGATNRFLVCEFKRSSEPLAPGQEWALRELARIPQMTVWLARARADGFIGFREFPSDLEHVITEEQYQTRVRDWWNEGGR